MPRAGGGKATAQTTDPNKLVRQRAGLYRTTDERFEVRQAALGWFLVDSAVTNEFGQELVRGPFATLEAVRDELPDARRTTLKSLPMPKASKARGGAGGAARRTAPPPAPPTSWLDQLPKPRAAAARRLIAAVEREGLPHAEELVQNAIEGRGPGLALPILEHRLDRILASTTARDPEAARRLVRGVVELLTNDGTGMADPLPGWVLVELGEEPAPSNRRLRPKVSRG
jgi:hypothetical protein